VAAIRPSIDDKPRPLRFANPIKSPQPIATGWQVLGKPFGQHVAIPTACHQCNATPDLRDRYDADERAILIETVQPLQGMCIGTRPCHLGKHIRGRQKSHSWRSRGSSRCRSRSRSAPRKSDCIRNSARAPLRAVFRCHSPAEPVLPQAAFRE